MQRVHEVSVKMGRKFFPSKNGNMMLTRSRDKKLISLVSFDRDNMYNDHFKVLAWTTKLRPHPVSQELNDGLNSYFAGCSNTFDSLEEIMFVGNCPSVTWDQAQAEDEDG